MIAYTSWDGLQAIARQYDADLSLLPGERLAMSPHWTQSVSRCVSHATERLRAGLAGMQEATRTGRQPELRKPPSADRAGDR